MENPLQAESGEFLRALFLFPTQDLVKKHKRNISNYLSRRVLLMQGWLFL